MDDLREKTIAALKKQIGLLSKDGVSSAEKEAAINAISALTKLLVATD